MRNSSPLNAFTLLELLAAVAIMGVLAALLVPMVRTGVERAKGAGCVTKLRNIAVASRLYTAENDGNIVPSQYFDKRLGAIPQQFWNTALLEFLNAQWNTPETRKALSCTEWRKVGPGYDNWNWAYGINDSPLYDEDDSQPNRRNIRVIIESDGKQNGTVVKALAISHASKRLQFCCSGQWQVNYDNFANNSFVAFDRHGTNRCNVAFFDGHIETLDREGIRKSILDPD